MHVTHLSLADFRSYARVEVPLDPGVSAFVGANGQGKTNLVEAIGYLATLSSHRVSSDAPLVRAGAERAVIRAAITQGDRSQLVELELNPGRANRARINRSSQVRPRDVVGIVRTVLFAPEDLALVKGDPGDRRRFLDELVTTRSPRMAGVRSDYERVLRQRNSLLKSAAMARRHGVTKSTRGAGRGSADASGTPESTGSSGGSGADLSTLDVWDQHLAHTGAELLAQRIELIRVLQPLTEKSYESLAPGGGPIALEYRSSAGLIIEQGDKPPSRQELYDQLIVALGEARKQEIERGVTLVGPHRDELVLGLGQLPAKGYASHGECWSFALALRLASYDLLRSEGNEPVLVLDDVFAELDARRRERLAELVAPGEQVLVTAAVDDDVPKVLSGARYAVADGEVGRL
ncbi:DNA replication/repair protein RecF [Streptomyces albipurpureus]|uniref:DNA replication and repair protein RecF n=1 Tax=Streptomyces albipurpureus TaxID=2897419 RepID=A0ABT0USH1_9ACTN|nr:DNA replication/repair protein RecF [Streptomyces sp. CWNU-1]MCM2391503.1 DNA replication/repair protein RecF [Streptomyces sp. CWNU-1]